MATAKSARPTEPWKATWHAVLRHIEKELGAKPSVCLVSGFHVTDTQERMRAFYEVFDAEKALTPGQRAKVPTPIVVSSTLCYKFRGDEEITSAEWLGVPVLDRIYYIHHSTPWRVALTGKPPPPEFALIRDD